MLKAIFLTFYLALLAVTTHGKNQQAWSHHTYNDEPYALKCKSELRPLTATDVITWHRHGMSGELMPNEHYELRTYQGTPNGELYVKKVTDDLHGIYICHIKDSNDVLLDSVVLGMNRGTLLYHDYFDKYKDNLVVGAIAAGSTFFVLISVCLISQFRYLSEESLEKRRQRKEKWQNRENGLKNPAFSGEVTEGTHQTNGSSVIESSYVHF